MSISHIFFYKVLILNLSNMYIRYLWRFCIFFIHGGLLSSSALQPKFTYFKLLNNLLPTLIINSQVWTTHKKYHLNLLWYMILKAKLNLLLFRSYSAFSFNNCSIIIFIYVEIMIRQEWQNLWKQSSKIRGKNKRTLTLVECITE